MKTNPDAIFDSVDVHTVCTRFDKYSGPYLISWGKAGPWSSRGLRVEFHPVFSSAQARWLKLRKRVKNLRVYGISQIPCDRNADYRLFLVESSLNDTPTIQANLKKEYDKQMGRLIASIRAGISTPKLSRLNHLFAQRLAKSQPRKK